ncbi:MAG: hypothetical protein EXS32_01520 [Opitutus sp.]|nr:hypothetical protein [Opitutus sp.]
MISAAVDSGNDCTRNLRGAVNDTTFVSFLDYPSDGTTFDIGGARLSVTASRKPGYLQISVDEPSPQGTQWRPLAELAKIERHDRASLAALPVLTVRLDPAAQVWALYRFNRLVAGDLPLLETKGAAGK